MSAHDTLEGSRNVLSIGAVMFCHHFQAIFYRFMVVLEYSTCKMSIIADLV